MSLSSLVRSGALAVLVSAFATRARAAEDRPRLLVSDLSAQGAQPEEAAAFTDAVVTTLTERGLFRVLSSRDLQALVSAERQREVLGACGEQAQECAANLGEAAGARFVMTGALSRLGATYQLTLQALDTARGQPLGRGTRLANDLSTLRLLLPYVVAEATGSPLPPPPSRIIPYSLLAGGGGAIVAGAFVGMMALGTQNTLNDELCPGGATAGVCHGTNLRPLSYYQSADRSLGLQKSASLGLMAGGAVLAAAGLYFMPPPEGGPRIALVPSGAGVALVGGFP